MDELIFEICQLSGEELWDKAIEFRNNEDYDNCYIYMTMSANYDDQLAKENIYIDDLYLKQDHTKTFSFNEKTAYSNEIKNSYSLNYLGFMYKFGLGVDKDYEKAIQLYECAIIKNNNHAMNNLAV